MEIRYDYSNVMAQAVGEDNGITEEEMSQSLKSHESVPRKLEQLRANGKVDYMNLPYDGAMADSISDFADSLRYKFENFVVLGIGGSSLGNRTLFDALCHPFYNFLSQEKRRGPRMFFVDNTDPDYLSGLFNILDPAKTLINVITKSGSTAETMANFMVFVGWLKKRLHNNYAKHVIATTDPEEGALRKIAKAEGFYTFPVPRGVGGRFSVLSAVGLVSSAFAGIDVHRILAGAESFDKRIKDSKPENNPALIAAIIHNVLDRKKGKHSAVFMPYAQKLAVSADWFCQLWAESLGKNIPRREK